MTPAAAHAARHRCIKGVDHCVVSCNSSSRKTRREIGQYLVDPTSFHLVHHISREVVRCPLDQGLIRRSGAASPSSSLNHWHASPGSSRSPIHDAGARPLFRHRAASPWREGGHLSCLGGRKRERTMTLAAGQPAARRAQTKMHCEWCRQMTVVAVK